MVVFFSYYYFAVVFLLLNSLPSFSRQRPCIQMVRDELLYMWDTRGRWNIIHVTQLRTVLNRVRLNLIVFSSFIFNIYFIWGVRFSVFHFPLRILVCISMYVACFTKSHFIYNNVHTHFKLFVISSLLIVLVNLLRHAPFIFLVS